MALAALLLLDGLHSAGRPAGAAAAPGAGRAFGARRAPTAKPGNAAMPYRSRPRTSSVPRPARPTLRRRLLGARRGAAARDRHAGDQSRRDDLPARPPVRPLEPRGGAAGRRASGCARRCGGSRPSAPMPAAASTASRARASVRACLRQCRRRLRLRPRRRPPHHRRRRAGTASDERVRRFLRAVHQAGCRRFNIGLSPDSDAYHYNHMHFDMGRGPYCR